MLVDQIAGIGRQICLSIKQLGLVGRYVGQSDSCVCWLVKQLVGRQVCWLVK